MWLPKSARRPERFKPDGTHKHQYMKIMRDPIDLRFVCRSCGETARIDRTLWRLLWWKR